MWLPGVEELYLLLGYLLLFFLLLPLLLPQHVQQAGVVRARRPETRGGPGHRKGPQRGGSGHREG
jgi:hypothetical protein